MSKEELEGRQIQIQTMGQQLNQMELDNEDLKEAQQRNIELKNDAEDKLKTLKA
jgi:hypothetical protein